MSGRGVGMDVVKRGIDALRGSIDVDSERGKGTVITVRLPLTLAIIDGLQIKVQNEHYVIPLSLVEECVELIQSDEERGRERQVLNLRGEIVPYIRLRDWFSIPGSPPPIEQVVVTGVDGSRVGIVVDNVIGEHQTVIKSLGRVYRDVDGISGATIKGRRFHGAHYRRAADHPHRINGARLGGRNARSAENGRRQSPIRLPPRRPRRAFHERQGLQAFCRFHHSS